MEALAHCAVRVRNGELEGLRDIISVHVMHGFHPQIGKDQLLTIREPPEYRGVEVSGWVEWRPARTDDVPGMEDRRSNYFAAHRLEQPFFDRRFPYPVVAKRLPRLRLNGRYDGAMSVDPGGSAMQEQRIARKRLNQMLRTVQCEANQIDDDIRSKGCNAVAECDGSFLCGSVDLHSLHFTPRGVWPVGFARSATRGDYVVSDGDESWNEEGADVAGSADDDDSNGRLGEG